MKVFRKVDNLDEAMAILNRYDDIGSAIKFIKSFDNVNDGLKMLNKFDNIEDAGKTIGKNLGEIGDVSDKLIDIPENLTIRNSGLAGKKHPVTGIEFNSQGFPKFDYTAQIKLDPNDYTKSNGIQFKRSNEALYKQIQDNPLLQSKFSDDDMLRLKNGDTPQGYTWHHHQQKGVMQLVDKKIHADTGHTGGSSIWGNNQ